MKNLQKVFTEQLNEDAVELLAIIQAKMKQDEIKENKVTNHKFCLFIIKSLLIVIKYYVNT